MNILSDDDTTGASPQSSHDGQVSERDSLHNQKFQPVPIQARHQLTVAVLWMVNSRSTSLAQAFAWRRRKQARCARDCLNSVTTLLVSIHRQCRNVLLHIRFSPSFLLSMGGPAFTRRLCWRKASFWLLFMTAMTTAIRGDLPVH